MAAPTTMQVLPTLPADWSNGESLVIGDFPALVRRSIEPVGRGYKLHVTREQNSEQEDANLFSTEEAKETEETDEGSFPGYDDHEPASLLKLDAGDWKNHDLYLILGLGKLRYKATDDDLRRAYRRKVLKHHPDKMASKTKGKGKVDDNFFKIIQKAYDILSDPVKRTHFDSCDPTFEEEIPSAKVPADKFYEVYNAAFENNARFSVKPNVPKLGDDSNDSDHVRTFYDFWYNFESWRVFNWVDEEDPGSAESREEKRYYEKLNEKARSELKKEDNGRIRRLTDQAAALDPRIRRMKQEEREKKERVIEAKRAQEEAVRMEAQRAVEAAAEAKRAQEAAAKEQAEADKKVREEKKKLAKKERKTLRQHVKGNNCYLPLDVSETSTRMFEAIARLDVLCEELAYDELVAFNESLIAAADGGAEIYLTRIGDMARLAETQASRAAAEEKARAEEKIAAAAAPWSDKEKALLIQAVKLFPGGAINRWGRITEHVNEHSGLTARVEKDVINEAKSILKDTGRVQDVALKIERRSDNVAPIDHLTTREEVGSEAPGAAEQPWTAAELEGFQTALRAVPATAENRWEKIAELVPTRSKKELIAKFKEIATLIKEKKGAK